MFMAAGYGLGWFSGNAREAKSGTASAALEYGVRVARTFDVIAGFAGALDATYSPDATMSQQTSFLLGGVRWSPFRDPFVLPRLFDKRGLYLQAQAGYGELDRVSASANVTAARGLGFSTAVGIDAAEGIRHDIGFRAFVQIFFPLVQRHGSM